MGKRACVICLLRLLALDQQRLTQESQLGVLLLQFAGRVEALTENSAQLNMHETGGTQSAALKVLCMTLKFSLVLAMITFSAYRIVEDGETPFQARPRRPRLRLAVRRASCDNVGRLPQSIIGRVKYAGRQTLQRG